MSSPKVLDGSVDLLRAIVIGLIYQVFSDIRGPKWEILENVSQTYHKGKCDVPGTWLRTFWLVCFIWRRSWFINYISHLLGVIACELFACLLIIGYVIPVHT